MEPNLKKIKSKGERLNWTPVKDTVKVQLKELDIDGRRIASHILKENKRFTETKKSVLIP
jgi:hypothetical protein